MEFNYFLFPKPSQVNVDNFNKFKHNIIYIPYYKQIKKRNISRTKLNFFHNNSLNNNNILDFKYTKELNKQEPLPYKYNNLLNISTNNIRLNQVSTNNDSLIINNTITTNLVNITIPKSINTSYSINNLQKNKNKSQYINNTNKLIKHEYKYFYKTKKYTASPDCKIKQIKNNNINSYFNLNTTTIIKTKHNEITNTNNLFIKKKQIDHNINNNEHLFQREKSKNAIYNIPCLLFLTTDFGFSTTNEFILYFHGNSEDIFNCANLCKKICFSTKKNVIVVEYPSYSIFSDIKSVSENILLHNCLYVYDHLKELGITKINIIGRSIGSGPACYISAKRRIQSLTLISPFTNIQDVIASFGYLLKYLIKQRFNNLQIIDQIKDPVLIIHGKKDKVVPFEHGIKLKLQYENSSINNNNKKYIMFKEFENMGHNISEPDMLIINPLMIFYHKVNNLI